MSLMAWMTMGTPGGDAPGKYDRADIERICATISELAQNRDASRRRVTGANML